EWEFWKHEYEAGREKSGCLADSVVPVVEAGQAVMVNGTYQVDPWLSYEPWVGHTPGHVGVRVHTRAGDAVFSGDLMHRVVQVAEPQWSSIFCYDAKQAAATRKAFVERHAASGDLVLPAHFPHPGRVVRDGDGHRFEPIMLDAIAVAWLLDFLGTADVLVQNLRPGSLEEMGLGPDTLLARHPRLVYCSVWAFGRSGPLKMKPGFEPTVQAFSGLMMMNGDEGGPPTRIGTSILDYGTGMWTAMGALAGLVQRQQTGRGCVVDASLYETGLAWLKGHFASYRASGEVPERHRTGSQRVVPFQGFETKTGTIIVAAGNDRLFAKLAAVVGHPEWAKDPRFVTNAARVDNKPALLDLLDAIFMTRTKGEWIDLLEAGGVPCGPIHSL